jgi:hypothetical protein
MADEVLALTLPYGIVKNVFQQGRSERKPEAYRSAYVEGLSDTRT